MINVIFLRITFITTRGKELVIGLNLFYIPECFRSNAKYGIMAGGANNRRRKHVRVGGKKASGAEVVEEHSKLGEVSGDAEVGEKNSEPAGRLVEADGAGADSKRRSAGAVFGGGNVKPGQRSGDAKVGRRKRGRSSADAGVDRGNCQPKQQLSWTPTKVHRLRFLKQTLYPVRCLAWEPNSKRLAVSRNEGG